MHELIAITALHKLGLSRGSPKVSGVGKDISHLEGQQDFKLKSHEIAEEERKLPVLCTQVCLHPGSMARLSMSHQKCFRHSVFQAQVSSSEK